MKPNFFIILLLGFLLLQACKQQQPRELEKTVQAATVIRDEAIVVLSPAISDEQLQTEIPQNKKAILRPTQEQLVFEKENSEKVVLDIQKLKHRYDILLFSPTKNPMPCKLADFIEIYAQYFDPSLTLQELQQLETQILQSEKSENLESLSDLAAQPSEMHLLPKKKIRQIISVPDTALQVILPRPIPNIEWIEHRVDMRKRLFVSFENDLISLANSDRYFTNGINIELQSPQIERLFPHFATFLFGRKAFTQYSFCLVQNMYTATDTRVEPALKNERPYASYLYFGFRKKTNDFNASLRMTHDLNFGIIGQYSPGAYFQKMVHDVFPTNDPPKGWDTQIKSDFLVNYNLSVEKALISKQKFLLTATLQSQLGTLYTNFGAGFRLQAGKFDPYFGFPQKPTYAKWQAYFFLIGCAKAVGYDATMQGGIFNKGNVFTLKANKMARLTVQSEAGISVSYDGFGLEISNTLLSPEYKGGLWHNWGRLTAIVPL